MAATGAHGGNGPGHSGGGGTYATDPGGGQALPARATSTLHVEGLRAMLSTKLIDMQSKLIDLDFELAMAGANGDVPAQELLQKKIDIVKATMAKLQAQFDSTDSTRASQPPACSVFSIVPPAQTIATSSPSGSASSASIVATLVTSTLSSSAPVQSSVLLSNAGNNSLLVNPKTLPTSPLAFESHSPALVASVPDQHSSHGPNHPSSRLDTPTSAGNNSLLVNPKTLPTSPLAPVCVLSGCAASAVLVCDEKVERDEKDDVDDQPVSSEPRIAASKAQLRRQKKKRAKQRALQHRPSLAPLPAVPVSTNQEPSIASEPLAARQVNQHVMQYRKQRQLSAKPMVLLACSRKSLRPPPLDVLIDYYWFDLDYLLSGWDGDLSMEAQKYICAYFFFLDIDRDLSQLQLGSYVERPGGVHEFEERFFLELGNRIARFHDYHGDDESMWGQYPWTSFEIMTIINRRVFHWPLRDPVRIEGYCMLDIWPALVESGIDKLEALAEVPVVDVWDGDGFDSSADFDNGAYWDENNFDECDY
jgi:hypothetical protein